MAYAGELTLHCTWGMLMSTSSFLDGVRATQFHSWIVQWPMAKHTPTSANPIKALNLVQNFLRPYRSIVDCQEKRIPRTTSKECFNFN
jgi:hypothetical protein